MDYLDVAIKAACIAGAIHRRYFRTTFKIRKKSSSFNLLTVADTESEKAIVSFIKGYYPQHNFLAEEKRYQKTDSEYTWVIDPLDGTNNFACRLPIFCSSIGLICKDEAIVGAVYDPMRNELFYARKGKGAFLNGRRIHVNNAKTLKEALLITGFYYSRSTDMERTLDTIKRFFLSHILGLRRLGAAALDLSYVACGRAAGFWEFELSPWDFCAGKLIVEEANGQVTGRRGEEVPLAKKYFIVASNGNIHSKMLKVMQE